MRYLELILKSQTSPNTIPLEILTWLGCLVLLIFSLKSMLVAGTTTLVHDNFYWFYPVFHHYARVLSQGELPLWDAYMHGGEAFYPLLLQLRLLEPISLLTVFLGKYFTHNSLILFNWNHFLLQHWAAIGAYLFLRHFSQTLFSRLSLIPILLFSSFFLGAFHQDGILSQFLWAPWIAYFLLRLFEYGDYSTKTFIFLGFAIGINFQSYQFAGPLVFLGLLLVALYFLEQVSDSLKTIFSTKGFYLSLIIILAMLAPNLVLMLEKNQFVYPLRTLPENFQKILLQQSGILPAEFTRNTTDVGIKIPYELIPYTGAFVKIWEFIQLLCPNGNPNIHAYTNSHTWGAPSEAYMYIGIWPFILACFGLCFGIAKWKKAMIFVTLSLGLMMMGPPGGVHRIFYAIYPPLWFLRHTDLLVLFFVLGLLYFFVLGVNSYFKEEAFKSDSLKGPKGLLVFCFVIEGYALLMAATYLNYPSFKFPLTNFLFVGVLIWATTYVVIRKLIGRWGLFLGIIGAHLLALLTLSPHRMETILHLSFFLGLPLIVLPLLKDTRIQKTCLFAILLLDLGSAFRSARFLYEGENQTTKTFNFSPDISVLPKPKSRELYSLYSESQFGRQIPRYLSLLRDTPTAFSTKIFFKGDTQTESTVSVAAILDSLSSPRFNSFLLTRTYSELINSSLKPEQILSAFNLGKGPIDLRKGNLTVEPNGIWDSLPLNIAKYHLVKYHFNDLSVDAETKSTGVLYFSDGYDPHWKLEIDGKSGRLFQANINFKAATLLEGNHRYRFYYEPTPFLWALGFFYGVPLIILGTYLLYLIYIRVSTWSRFLAWQHA